MQQDIEPLLQFMLACSKSNDSDHKPSDARREHSASSASIPQRVDLDDSTAKKLDGHNNLGSRNSNVETGTVEGFTVRTPSNGARDNPPVGGWGRASTIRGEGTRSAPNSSNKWSSPNEEGGSRSITNSYAAKYAQLVESRKKRNQSRDNTPTRRLGTMTLR
eukprot:6981843-Pyramimonas_sp.AAC.2